MQPPEFPRPLDCTDPNEFPPFLSFESASGDLTRLDHDLRCNAGLYGGSGCGLEAQLESMYRALVIHDARGAPLNTSPNAGFVRADALAASGYAIVLTGAAEEAELAAELTRRMHAAAVNLCGKTPLGGLARLIQRARLIVCNDTGVSHVAAAVGTPSVVVCCGADPLRWAPLDAVKHRVLHLPLDCRPCMHAVCPIGHACALGITPDRVVEEALGLLRSRVRTGAAQEALQ